MLEVFVSVGGPANVDQEAFVAAVEDRLRIEGLIPHTVGRNTFSSDAPLRTVTELLDQCSGTVVIALERSFFPAGYDKRGGPKETRLVDVRLPTPWNHIEAAMAYSRGHAVLMLVEDGLKVEGLLEPGYDWYVQRVKPVPSSLATAEFNGVLASWKSKLGSDEAPTKLKGPTLPKAPAEFTISELATGLRPAQLWGVFSALAALVGVAFAAGNFFGAHHWHFN